MRCFGQPIVPDSSYRGSSQLLQKTAVSSSWLAVCIGSLFYLAIVIWQFMLARSSSLPFARSMRHHVSCLSEWNWMTRPVRLVAWSVRSVFPPLTATIHLQHSVTLSPSTRSFNPSFTDGTKSRQARNFLEQFSLVQRNSLTNFSLCSFYPHWHNIITIRHIYCFCVCVFFSPNPTVPFCSYVSKICLKYMLCQNVLHKSSNT
jgi:hypothetical protein